MILRIPKNASNLTDFEKKYMGLFQEADGDSAPPIKEKEVKVKGGRRYSTKQVAINNDLEDEEIEATLDETDDLDDPEDDDVEIDEEDMDTSDEEDMDDETEDMEDDNADDVEDDDVAIDDSEDQGESDADDAEGDGAETDEGDGEEGSDVAIDDSEDPGDSGDGDGENSDQETDSSSNKVDAGEAIHKQNLYRKFLTLYNSIDNYSQKLSNIVSNDVATTKQYYQLTDRLKNLKELMYDFMTVKFMRSSYVEAMLFYQRSIAAVDLCLDLLEKVKKSSIDSNRKR